MNEQPQSPPIPQKLPPGFPMGLFCGVWLFVVISGLLVTFMLPETYVGVAIIRLTIQGVTEAHFIQTEFEVIQAEVVLGRVAEALNLNSAWGMKSNSGSDLETQESIMILRRRLDLRLKHNTSLIEIRVYADNPNEAAELANAIAGAYRDHRREQRRLMTEQGIKALEQTLKEQADRIRQKEEAIEDLSRTNASARMVASAKEELEDLQRFRETLIEKINVERTNVSLPAGVEIIDTAKPNFRPVRPNKPLNMALAVVIGTVLGTFSSALVYVRRRRAYESAEKSS